MYVSLYGRSRTAGLAVVLLTLALGSISDHRATAQESAMRWDGLIELISGRFPYQPPIVEPPTPADAASAMSTHAISVDGRFILFNSDASNLAPYFSGPALYLRDRRTNEVRMLLGGPALNGTLSADGRYAAFEICDQMGRPMPRPDDGAICDIYTLDLQNWRWTLISALPDGTFGDDHSTRPVLSQTGRFVVFRTKAVNLAGGAPGVTQLVIHDRDGDQNGILDEPGSALLETVSVAGGASPTPGDHDSDTPEVSDDGRFIAFRSRAGNLVAGDSNLAWDVFLRDRYSQVTRRINLRGGNEESTSSIDSPQISMTPYGRYIAYASADPMLAPASIDDVNNVLDVFVHDTWTGSTSRLDVGWGPPIAAGLIPGNGPTSWPTLSDDGRYVSVQSAATNVEIPPPAGSIHAYVIDRLMQTVTRVSTRPDGVEADRDAVRPSISGDGSLVTFISQALNLSPQVTTEVDRIYAAVHLELTPSEVLVPGSGGPATFTVTTQQHTQWWLDWTTWANWWQIEAPPSGVGSGEIRLRVPDPNPDVVRRSYTVKVMSKTAVLTQLEGMSLTSISPSSGPATGGTRVTLTGTGFEPGARVVFAGYEAVTEFVNATTLIATTPPYYPSTVWVATFSADYRQNAWLDNAFRYTDTTPPQVFVWVDGQQSTDGWYTSDATVWFGWLDDESEVTATTGCNTVVVASDTTGTTFTCTATSEGGTASQSVTIKRDGTPPAIAVTSPVSRQLFEPGSAAQTNFTCSDALSGVAQCGASAPSGAPLDTSTAGWHGITFNATDIAGNIGFAALEYAVSTNVCVPGLPDMAAWWRMEGTTRNTRSNVATPATRVGLTSDVYADAVAGQGYQFEGTNGYLNTGFAYRIPGDLKYGIAAWVKPSANTYGTILRKKDQYSVARTSNGTLAWAFRKFNNPTLTYVDTGVAIPLNLWSHIAVVLDGATVVTYVNGRPAHTATDIGDVYTWETMSEPITIGGAQDRGDYFKGILDELQIFMHGLTGTQIEDLFLAGPAGACPPKATQLSWAAPIRATFGAPTYRIELSLRDENEQPVANRTVHLESIVGAAPYSTSTANRVTDANGVVTWDAPLKNAPPGTYTDFLSATFDGDAQYVRAYAEPDVVVDKATPTITWPTPGTIAYGTALGALQLNATANVAGTFTYAPASGSILSAGTHTLTATFIPSDPTYYTAASSTVALTVTKAAPVIAVSGGTFTYDGQPHAATGTARGNDGADLGPLTFTYNGAPDAPVSSGSYSVIGSFAGNANYAAGTSTATITIGKATPAIAWNTPAAIVYGTPLGAAQLSATANVAGDFTYAPATGTVLSAGTHTVSVTFTPTDSANYDSAAAATSIDVGKALPTVIVNGGTFTYDGQPHAATGSVDGVGGASLGPLTFTYSGSSAAPVAAGVYAIVGSFAGDANHQAATGTATITIDKASPELTWNRPTTIVFGALLGSAELNATASVSGSFTYTPAAGMRLNAGVNQSLTAQFTPTDVTNYRSATISTSIDVTKAPATVSIAGGTFIYDGQPHPATGSVTGVGGTSLGPLTFTYNGEPAVPVAAGSYSVVGSFTGDENHQAASGTSTIVIGRATPALSWPTPASVVYGTPIGAMHLAATSNVPGSFSYSLPAGTVLPAGNHSVTATFTPADGTNYSGGTVSTSIGVTLAPLAIRATDASKPFGAPLPAFGATYGGFVNGDTPASLMGALALATNATQQSAVGAYQIVPNGISSPNYAVTFVAGVLSVTKGATTVTVSSSPAPSGLGQPMVFRAQIDPIAPASGAPGGAVQFFDGPTLLGTAAIVGDSASITTAGLAAGSHAIEARYLGDASFANSAGTASHVVTGASSTPALTVSSSRNPSSAGQSVTLTANVSMPSGPVSGNVQFWDGATLIGTSAISAGKAMLATATLTNGSHAITARFVGSASAPPAVSGVFVQAVGTSAWKNRSTITSVATSANPSALGAAVTITATVVGSSSSVPNSRVLFMINGTVVGDPAGVPVTWISGTTARASMTVTGLAHGAHKVTVTYLGDTTYKGSTGALTQTVN